jgi:hypothetical protein
MSNQNWQHAGNFIGQIKLRFFVYLIAFELLLVILNLLPIPSVTIVRLLDLDGEFNLPTWFSSSQLLLLAFTALVAWKLDSGRWLDRHGWLLLGLLFLYLSVDETAIIHESFGAAATKQFHWTWWGDNFWVIVFWPLILIGIASLVFVFWRKLKQRRAALFASILGSGLWILALCLEVLEKWLVSNSSLSGLGGKLLMVNEEFCEMAGATILWLAVSKWVQARVSVHDLQADAKL